MVLDYPSSSYSLQMVIYWSWFLSSNLFEKGAQCGVHGNNLFWLEFSFLNCQMENSISLELLVIQPEPQVLGELVDIPLFWSVE